MIGEWRALLKGRWTQAQPRLFSYGNIAVPEKAALFRVREILDYHPRGYS